MTFVLDVLMKAILANAIIFPLIGCGQRDRLSTNDLGDDLVSIKSISRVPENVSQVIDSADFAVYSNEADVFVHSKFDNTVFMIESLEDRHRPLSDFIFDSPGILNFNRWLNPHCGYHVEVDCFDKTVILTRPLYDSFSQFSK